MSEEIKLEEGIGPPTVGQIVHYHVGSFDSPELRHNHAEDEVLPAIVVRVWSDTCVNLKVFTDGPVDAWKTSAMRGDDPGQWNFIPYELPLPEITAEVDLSAWDAELEARVIRILEKASR